MDIAWVSTPLCTVRPWAEDSREGDTLAFFDVLLESYRLKGLSLKNRIIGTSHGPAYAERALPTERYQHYHEEKATVGLPLFHATRIIDVTTAAQILRDGAIDLVGMTRAHMADPQLVNKLTRGEEERIRPGVGAGYCIDRIYRGGEAL